MTDPIPNITRAIACVVGSTLLDDISPAGESPHATAIAVLDAEAERLAPTLSTVPALIAANAGHFNQAAAILRELAPDAETAATLCETPSVVESLRAAPKPDPRLEPFLVDVLADHPDAQARDLWLIWVRVAEALDDLGAEASADDVCEYVIESTPAGFYADGQTFATAALLARIRQRG